MRPSNSGLPELLQPLNKCIVIQHWLPPIEDGLIYLCPPEAQVEPGGLQLIQLSAATYLLLMAIRVRNTKVQCDDKAYLIAIENEVSRSKAD
jgi:hypothetical protein